MKIILALTFCATSFLVLGCGKSPCDQLSDECAKCTDQATKTACSTAASDDALIPITGQNACQQLLDQKTFANCM
jgi:hypothetical protein